MSAELFTMTDHLSITDQLLVLYVYDLHLKNIEQHLQAAQEVLHWKFSPREIKEDVVKNQRTVPALQKENCSLNPEEALQKEPVEEEVLKISVEEAAAVASVLETVQVSHPEQTSEGAVNTSAMEKKSRRERKLSLYRGWFPVISSLCCSNLVYFYTFNTLKRVMVLDRSKPHKDLLMGFISGAVNVLLTTPMWVVNTRLKLQGAKFRNQDLHQTHYKGMFGQNRSHTHLSHEE